MLIGAAYTVIKLKRGGDAHFNEQLELAQVHYSHALRRFKQENPEFWLLRLGQSLGEARGALDRPVRRRWLSDPGGGGGGAPDRL